MPDSVRCYKDSANTFTCEVDVEPDPAPSATPSANTAPAPAVPAAPSPPTDPAVSGLVASYRREVGRETIAPIDPPFRELAPRAARDCASNGIGIVLLAGTKGGVLGALLGLKTGLDTMKCIANSKYELSGEETRAAAAAICTASGGVVTGEQDHVTMCNVNGSQQ